MKCQVSPLFVVIVILSSSHPLQDKHVASTWLTFSTLVASDILTIQMQQICVVIAASNRARNIIAYNLDGRLPTSGVIWVSLLVSLVSTSSSSSVSAT